ncbi:unnamed protein product [Trichogramma brassicae]|uniref:Uncharacterized protein n=1 Tax=Trichogramma brassicae TaxID=86971 RepID=A0A6H5J8N1_9HYME|nr:unnamed protein product [Trichogramma brassicae]
MFLFLNSKNIYKCTRTIHRLCYRDRLQGRARSRRRRRAIDASHHTAASRGSTRSRGRVRVFSRAQNENYSQTFSNLRSTRRELQYEIRSQPLSRCLHLRLRGRHRKIPRARSDARLPYGIGRSAAALGSGSPQVARGRTAAEEGCRSEYDRSRGSYRSARDLPETRDSRLRIHEDAIRDLRRERPNGAVDARDRLGKTALHLALTERHGKLAELLLRRGADPNLADARGSTPLRTLIHKRQRNDCSLIKFLFRVCDEVKRRVQLDTVDESGRSPVHLALEYNDAELFALLLRRGADPSATNAEGVTPLRVCLRSAKNVGLAEILFKTYEEMRQPVPIDARDSAGWTPLQWAVASVLPHAVDLLLDRGADLSSFVFPTESRFDGRFFSENGWQYKSLKLGITSGALAIADSLEKRGYELERSDALAIMKFFAEQRLYEESTDLEIRREDSKQFVKKAKKTMIKPSLSLYDLVELSPREAARRLTHRDYFEFWRSNKFRGMPIQSVALCASQLAEKLSRRFFRRWALDPLMELTHCRLPILCCEMIVEQLMNQDLYDSEERAEAPVQQIYSYTATEELRGAQVQRASTTREIIARSYSNKSSFENSLNAKNATRSHNSTHIWGKRVIAKAVHNSCSWVCRLRRPTWLAKHVRHAKCDPHGPCLDLAHLFACSLTEICVYVHTCTLHTHALYMIPKIVLPARARYMYYKIISKRRRLISYFYNCPRLTRCVVRSSVNKKS